MSGQHCESYDVKRETVHCYPVNIEILRKQNSLFPSGPVIKCLLLTSSADYIEEVDTWSVIRRKYDINII